MSRRPQSESIPTRVKQLLIEGKQTFQEIQKRLTDMGYKQRNGHDIAIPTIRRAIHDLSRKYPSVEKEITETNGKRIIRYYINKKKHEELIRKRLKEIDEQTKPHTKEMTA